MNEVSVFIIHVLDAYLVQIQHYEYHLVIIPAHYMVYKTSESYPSSQEITIGQSKYVCMNT